MFMLYHARVLLRRLEIAFKNAAVGQFPPTSFAIIGTFEPATNQLLGPQDSSSRTIDPSPTLEALLKNTILWAAPRNRRTIEKRLCRKFGSPERVYKMLSPKTTLLTCQTCGHHHETGILCPYCYEKVCQETKEIQEVIQEDLGIGQIYKDIVVLYDGEKPQLSLEVWEAKRTVEMKKARPIWFSKNLIQSTTTKIPSTSSDVKPSNLA